MEGDMTMSSYKMKWMENHFFFVFFSEMHSKNSQQLKIYAQSYLYFLQSLGGWDKKKRMKRVKRIFPFIRQSFPSSFWVNLSTAFKELSWDGSNSANFFRCIWWECRQQNALHTKDIKVQQKKCIDCLGAKEYANLSFSLFQPCRKEKK